MAAAPWPRGGPMKIVRRNNAKALKGDKSLSYQVISPSNVGSRKFLITVVDVRPGGSTPVHEHRTVESMYYVLEGRGEVTSGHEKKVLGPDPAAEEKPEVYRSDASLARTLDADVQHTETTLATLPRRIAARRAQIAEESWATETFAGLPEIPIASYDRSFASVRKEDLSLIAP